MYPRPLRSTYTVFFLLMYMTNFLAQSLLKNPCSTRSFFRHFSTTRYTSSILSSTRMADQSPPIVVVIAGPTAAGKSDVAAQLCVQQKGMIVSADSVQAYRGVQIGANKPSLEERKETPHILIDVADHVENYNAAEWREDAIYCIRTLLGRGNQEQQDTSVSISEASCSRRAQIQEYIRQARIDKAYDDDTETKQQQSILPVVCGGTMMYLQWLVHGRPDAMKPTPKAIETSYNIIQEFQEKNNDYDGAVEKVSSFGEIFAGRAKNLTSGDWYRLRRTLEIALTVEEMMQRENDESSEKSESSDNVNNLVEQLYSGERQGSLSSLGFDVRCFFLCPDDRMSHTRVVDKRCEQMLMKGLLKETTDLSLSGCLPEMAERAIGYRQTLDYLSSERRNAEGGNVSDDEAFEFYLNEFTTATRRYAKKQMAWFRKDKDFMFIPVSLKSEKSDRVSAAANNINRLCKLSREDYEKELFGGNEYVSGKTKQQNEEQGKKMKFYKPERHILIHGSKEYEEVLAEAVQCRHRFMSNKDRKRTREGSSSPNRKK